MSHTPKITSSCFEYYDFNTSDIGGPQHVPDTGIANFRGNQIKDRQKEWESFGYQVGQITPIQQGAIDYMGDHMSVGGTSLTTGLVILYQQTCCSARKWQDSAMQAEENRNNPDMWLSWILKYSACENIHKASEISKVAMIKFPENSLFAYTLACYETILGNLESGEKYLNKAITMDKKWGGVAKTDADLFPLIIKGVLKP